MAESLGTAVLDLSTDESGLEKGLGSAESTTKSRMGRIGGVIGKATKVAAAGFVAAGAAGIAAAFKTASYGDEIAKTATKLGITTDALQEMRYWGDRNGISAQSLDRAVGRLNQRIGRAAAGNDKYADAFADLGVEIEDSEGKIRSTEEVMQDTIAALRDMEDPAMQSAAASEIFGTKMARDLMPALQDGSLSLEEAAEKAQELGIVMDGDALDAAERFQDNWADVKDSVMGFVRQGAAPLMAMLADRVFPFIRDTAVPILQRFGDWLGPKIEAAAQQVVTFFDTVLVPAFQRLTEWWEANGPAIIATAQQLWDGLQAVFDGIAGAVRKVIGWFQSSESEATGAFASIQSFAAKTFPQLVQIVTSAVDAIRAVIERVTAIIAYIWEKWGDGIMAYVKTAWSAVQKIISGALDIIQGIFEVFAGLFSGDWGRLWDGIKQILSGAWQVIRGLVQQGVNLMNAIVDAAMSLLQGLWDRAWAAIKRVASAAWEALVRTVSSGVDSVVGWLRGLPGRALSALSSLIGDLRQRGQAAMRAMREAIVDQAQSAVTWLAGLPARMLRALGSLRTMLLSAGKDLILGLIDGIKNMASNAANAAKNAVKGAVDGAKSFLRIGSPSKVFADIGEDTIAGFLVGVEHESAQVDHAIRDAITVPDAESSGAAESGMADTSSLLRRIAEAVEEGQADWDRVARTIGRETAREQQFRMRTA